LFSDAFDDWSHADFLEHIYNDAYIEVDPDYREDRPISNANVIVQIFRDYASDLNVLDFGGGNGCFARELAKAGFSDPQTYDPFHPDYCDRPRRKFDLVTCFETIEHMPNPKTGAEEIVSFLSHESLLLLSTLVQPDDIFSQRMGWWYAAARNGHITLFSYRSMATLFGNLGFQVYPTSARTTHLICREIPAFARRAMAELRPLQV